jgi:hypothetical protein
LKDEPKDLAMTEELTQKVCTPCRGGIPPLTREEAERYLGQVQNWELLDDARQIERTYRFKSFREALAFVQGVGALAPRLSGITPTSASAGATPGSRSRPRRSRDCTRTTSSWRPRSTVWWRAGRDLVAIETHPSRPETRRPRMRRPSLW